MQEYNSVIQWALLGVMGLIILYFIWAAITNFLNFIFGIVGLILSVIATFFVWQSSDSIAYFLSPDPAGWLYWAIPLATPFIVFTIVIIVKNRIGYSANQDEELELERRRKNHQLTDKDKESETRPKKSFFKQLFTTLFLSMIFISCLLLYLTISGKSSFLQDALPDSAKNFSTLTDLESITDQMDKLKDIQDLGVLSQFILFEAQAPRQLQQMLSNEDYQTIMQLPVKEWLEDPSFNNAAQQESNAGLLLKIVKKAPQPTPETKAALANFEVATKDNFEK